MLITLLKMLKDRLFNKGEKEQLQQICLSLEKILQIKTKHMANNLSDMKNR